MDCSVEYTLMCEKAVDIRKNWFPQEGDYYVPFKPYLNWFIISKRHNKKMRELIEDLDCIWLPRQDQLQEIVRNNRGNDGLLQDFYFWEHNPSTKTGYCNSMEQLWLGFVMFEKFSKHWNGEEWK